MLPEKLLETSNYKLVYTAIGAGTPVVLLHGFGEDRAIWEHQINFLKEHCRLLIPDLPCTGNSVLLNTNDLTIEWMADAIYALLLKEKIDQCILLGHSMGGYITLAFAEKYPEKLLRFGLVHSTAYADSEEKKQTRQKSIDLIEHYGAYAFLKSTIPNLFGTAFKKESPEIVEELIEKGKDFTKICLQHYTKAMMLRSDKSAVLTNSSVPVLFIAGTEDLAAPLTDLQAQSQLPKKSYIEVLDGVAHMGMLEATQAMNQHLLGFIQL